MQVYFFSPHKSCSYKKGIAPHPPSTVPWMVSFSDTLLGHNSLHCWTIFVFAFHNSSIAPPPPPLPLVSSHMPGLRLTPWRGVHWTQSSLVQSMIFTLVSMQHNTIQFNTIQWAVDTGHPSNSPFNTIAQYSDASDTPLKYVQYLQDGHLAKYCAAKL